MPMEFCIVAMEQQIHIPLLVWRLVHLRLPWPQLILMERRLHPRVWAWLTNKTTYSVRSLNFL
jgi:hypothetical protein